MNHPGVAFVALGSYGFGSFTGILWAWALQTDEIVMLVVPLALNVFIMTISVLAIRADLKRAQTTDKTGT